MGMPVSKWESIEAQIQISLKTAQDFSVDLNDCVDDVQVNSHQHSDWDEIHATVSKFFIRVDVVCPIIMQFDRRDDVHGQCNTPSAIRFCYTRSKLDDSLHPGCQARSSMASILENNGKERQVEGEVKVVQWM